MKKIFLLLFIVIPFIFMDNVEALTFERCGNQVELTNDNAIYYYYQKYPSYFTRSGNFTFFRNNFNHIYLITWGRPTFGSVVFNFTNTTNNPTIRYTGYFSSVLVLGNDLSNPVIRTNRTLDNLNISTFYSNVDIYDGANNSGNIIVPANITISDLQDYFNNCAPPPPPYDTKNLIFTDFLLTLTSLVPYILVFILIFEGVGWFINKKD